MHSSIVLTLTSVVKLQGRLARCKPPVSWRPLWKDLDQCWIVHFAKHSSLYPSLSLVHVSPLSFPNRLQKSIADRCLERMCIFFSVSHTDQHTHGFTETTVVVILAVHSATLSCSKDLLIPFIPMCFWMLYLVPLLFYGAFTSTSRCW